MRDAYDFSRLEEFWEEFKPHTPYGREHRDAREIVRDRAELERRYDRIDHALSCIDALADDPVSLDRVSYHLKRVPRLPAPHDGDLELVELFQYKKFLTNYRAVARLVDSATRERFDLVSLSDGLAREFERGGSDPETFYVADEFDPALAEARREIAALDDAIRAIRAAAEGDARTRHGIEFDGRPFVTVPAEKAEGLFEERGTFSIEAYDSGSFTVSLVKTQAELELDTEREGALERERGRESVVIARLSAMIAGERANFGRYVRSVGDFDIAFAFARLAREWKLVRPRLDGTTLRIEQGRFVPCMRDCEKLGIRYTPLDVDLDARIAVLFGSNMGGKTVALRTIAFMQLLAQAGCFVPAVSFSTRAFSSVRYVGELRGDRATGLSGFGFEIRSFIEAWDGMDDESLVLLDEFARTTGSHEAEAILSAVVEAVSGKRGVHAIFATHFRGVARVDGVRYLRMSGLDRDSLLAAQGESGREPTLEERIAGINRHMAYALVPDDGSRGTSDAIDIAALLGLDKSIIDGARRHFGGA